jgi:hypothetical protein
MANVFSVNVYQINGSVLTAPQKIGFPTTGVLLRDCSTSATKVLPNGTTVNGVVQIVATGQQYYTVETQAALVTLVG